VVQLYFGRSKVIGIDLALSFPAKDLVNPELFTSLLFYYGMLTIIGTRGDRLILGIPNNNVRKQYYDYMLEQWYQFFPLNNKAPCHN